MVLTRRQQKEENKEKIFNDEKIMKTILDNVADNVTEILPYRLINKAFNSKITQQIRKSHKKIFIDCEIVDDVDDDGKVKKLTFYWINNNKVISTKLTKYFEFLQEIPDFKVVEVRVRGVWRLLNRNIRISFHKALLDVLLVNQAPKVIDGIGELCPKGCSRCMKLVGNCTEYGPIQENMLKKTRNEVEKYETLIVNESLLCFLRSECTKFAGSPEACLKNLQKLVNNKLQCDNLTLVKTETGVYFPGTQEIVQQLCSAWAPRAIKIRYEQSMPIGPEILDSFSGKRVKRVNFPNSEIEIPKYEKVEIEVEEGSNYWNRLITPVGQCRITSGTVKNHMIQSIRTQFPTDKILITGDHNQKGCYLTWQLEQHFTKIAWTELREEEGLELTIRFFIDISDDNGMAHAECFKARSIEDKMGRKDRTTILAGFKFLTLKIDHRMETFRGITRKNTIEGSSHVVLLEIYVKETDFQKAREEFPEAMELGLFRDFMRNL